MTSFGDSIVKGIGYAIGIAFGAMFATFLVFLIVFTFSAGLGAGMAQSGLAAAQPSETDFVYQEGKRDSKNHVLALRVDGIILGTPVRNLANQLFPSGITYGYAVKAALQQGAKDDRVKAAFIHVQTPGGTIFGSRAIHDGITTMRQAKKPVVVYVEGLSASGGVLATAGADRIYADHGSFIGSVGVLGPQLVYYDDPVAFDGGLLGEGVSTRGGIEQTIVSAGRGKDLGNPFRRPTPEELDVLQRGVDSEYAAFVTHVARNRGLDEAVVRDQMGAHIFGTADARTYKLIDDVKDRGASLDAVADLAKLGDDYQLVKPRVEQGGLLSTLLSTRWFGRQAPASAASSTPVPGRLRLDAATCESLLRAPLAYYGDATLLCR